MRTITRKNKKNKKKTRKYRGGLKKMNCSPAVKGKTMNKITCFTKEVLYQIRDSFNKHHPNKKIISKDPKKVWIELKSSIQNCDKEDCWLKEIENYNLRKKIDDFVFAPDQPPEWKTNKNEWLSNYDILNVLQQYEKTYSDFHFIGPTPIDFDTRIPEENTCVWEELCKFSLKQQIDKGFYKIGIIFNLDKHDESGSHWVSLFIDVNDCILFYFDSAGESCPEEIKRFVERVIKQGNQMKIPFEFYENHPTVHQMGNTECGMYSLFFIITMLTSECNEKLCEKQSEGGNVIQTKKEKIDFFKNNGRIPDKFVEKYRSIYFNTK